MVSITRKKLLDRLFSLRELNALTAMVRAWYLATPTRIAPGAMGYCRCEVYVYSFPREAGQSIAASISARTRNVAVDASDPDELRFIGPMQLLEGPGANLSLWQAALSDPTMREACLLLRFTIGDWPLGKIDGPPNQATTIALCGMPDENETFLAKAIWSVGTDEAKELIWRGAKWSHENALLHALDLYKRTGDVTLSQAVFTNSGPNPLFHSRGQDRFVMWWVRQRAELPDERDLRSFIRRVGLSLLSAVVAFAGAKMIMARVSRVNALMVILVLIAAYFLYAAIYMTWRKARKVRQYYKRMRAGLAKLHSKPIEYHLQDLSSDRTPTLLKYSADIAALGGRHVCDLRITTANRVMDSNRVYAVGDTLVFLGLLRNTESLTLFPPKPIIILATRFTDGRRHGTVNTEQYRKNYLPHVTGRSLPLAGLQELWVAHRREVDRLIAAGAQPRTPPTTYEALTEIMKSEQVETRERYLRHPYSWTDAYHAAFKITRREYRPDA